MDLAFARLRPFAAEPAALALGVLLVTATARQAASPVAALQARLSRPLARAGLLAPRRGAFHAGVAARLAGWREA